MFEINPFCFDFKHCHLSPVCENKVCCSYISTDGDHRQSDAVDQENGPGLLNVTAEVEGGKI